MYLKIIGINLIKFNAIYSELDRWPYSSRVKATLWHFQLSNQPTSHPPAQSTSSPSSLHMIQAQGVSNVFVRQMNLLTGLRGKFSLPTSARTLLSLLYSLTLCDKNYKQYFINLVLVWVNIYFTIYVKFFALIFEFSSK